MLVFTWSFDPSGCCSCCAPPLKSIGPGPVKRLAAAGATGLGPADMDIWPGWLSGWLWIENEPELEASDGSDAVENEWL